MKWLLGMFGLLSHYSNDRNGLMARVRVASDKHAVEATSSSQRVEGVIFRTRQSGLLAAIDRPRTPDHIADLLRKEQTFIGKMRGEE